MEDPVSQGGTVGPKQEEAHEPQAAPSATDPLPAVGEDSQELDSHRFLNREITWLSFNGRVLQEAADPRVPLLDRLKFLAIFSSNLDEFFRVRVASLRSLLRLKKKKRKKLSIRPRRLLREIHFVVTEQQDRYGNILRNSVLPELEAKGVFLLNNRTLNADQKAFLDEHLQDTVLPHLVPTVLEDGTDPVFLEEGGIYLAVELWPNTEQYLAAERPIYGLVRIPSPPLPRFVVVPGEGHNVIFLDDVVRLSLDVLFPAHEVGSAYAIKLTRDADLYLDEEFEGDLVAKIEKSLEKRATGLPSRFLYDLQAPYGLVSFLKAHLSLEDDDLVPGGRYHNLQDFFQFPAPPETEGLLRSPLDPLPHPVLGGAPSVIEAVQKRDQILHFPYQSFDHVLRLFDEAAESRLVDRIWITLYRVAEDSGVVQSLIKAARRGADVRAFVEVQARFDEARNLRWAAEMEEAGVRVFYSRPNIKVHAKIALVSHRRPSGRSSIAYLGTGNFNEASARIYADHALLTADSRLTDDVYQVFRYLWEEVDEPEFKHLLVSPFVLREALSEKIAREARVAAKGMRSGMVLKMNSLEDQKMMDLLHTASQAGVEIDLIVRGICRLKPGLPSFGESIRGRSIVDRFLEHARIFRFHNEGRTEIYLASADLMKRNLSRRVEVAFPIFDPDIRIELEANLELQLADNTKARILDPEQENRYATMASGEAPVEAQRGFYDWLQSRTVLNSKA